MIANYRPGAVVHLYVLGASTDPDRVECCVPWEVDQREIFFGPCKKSLRLHLKRSILRDAEEATPESDVYVVGLNALASPRSPRKIVWAGRINRVRTFARAFEQMSNKRYDKLLNVKESPMHVEPLRGDDGALFGYRFRPNGDHPKDWFRDLITTDSQTILEGDCLRLKPGVSPSKGFGRDLCFTADNLFFARGQGLEIDAELLKVLKKAQPAAEGVDSVAVFGRNDVGKPDGYRGRYLTISEPDLVAKLLGWLHSRADAARNPGAREGAGEKPTRRSCG